MSTLAIDTYRLLTALKGTGKSANYSAEEIASAIHAAQEGAELLTRSEFGVRMDAFDARMDAFEARIDAKIDAKIEALRVELKAGQLQNLLWLSGIVLVSNGMVVGLLARLAHVV